MVYFIWDKISDENLVMIHQLVATMTLEFQVYFQSVVDWDKIPFPHDTLVEVFTLIFKYQHPIPIGAWSHGYSGEFFYETGLFQINHVGSLDIILMWIPRFCTTYSGIWSSQLSLSQRPIVKNSLKPLWNIFAFILPYDNISILLS